MDTSPVVLQRGTLKGDTVGIRRAIESCQKYGFLTSYLTSRLRYASPWVFLLMCFSMVTMSIVTVMSTSVVTKMSRSLQPTTAGFLRRGTYRQYRHDETFRPTYLSLKVRKKVRPFSYVYYFLKISLPYPHFAKQRSWEHVAADWAKISFVIRDIRLNRQRYFSLCHV